MDVRVGLWRKLSAKKLVLLNCGVGEDSWESLGLQGYPTSPSWRRSVLGVNWKDWCWSWNSNTLATSCKELTHWKRPWCWEGFGAGGEGDDRGWDGWMASPTRWTWVWVNSWSWWWTGRPGVLRFMGSKRVGHDWVTELNWFSLRCSLGDFAVFQFIDSFFSFLHIFHTLILQLINVHILKILAMLSYITFVKYLIFRWYVKTKIHLTIGVLFLTYI